jgi:SAM-dependent methyltransferase
MFETTIVREQVLTSPVALDPPARGVPETVQGIPSYLEDYYRWAYLRPASLAAFDHDPIVSAILWGQYGRLKRAALAEIRPGQRVLQAACVYGGLSPLLAGLVGEDGGLDVVDVVPLQVANCRRKLVDFPHAVARLADVATPGGGPYDAVLCFFLLHELPDDRKRAVVDGLLGSLAPGGKVIFIDYHRPHFLHPLMLVQNLVFTLLEPFAKRLWQTEIAALAKDAGSFDWRKQTYFGGLFQKVVATPSAALIKA